MSNNYIQGSFEILEDKNLRAAIRDLRALADELELALKRRNAEGQPSLFEDATLPDNGEAAILRESRTAFDTKRYRVSD